MEKKKQVVRMISSILTLALLFIAAGCATRGTVLKGSMSPADTPRYHYNIGMRLLDNGDLDGAEKEFRRGISLYRKDGQNYQGLALIYIEKGYYKQAMRNIKKALKYSKHDANNYIVRGRLYDAREQYKKAVKEYKKAIKINSMNPVAYYFLAKTYIKTYRFNEAEDALNKALYIEDEFKPAKEEKQRLTRIRKAEPGELLGKGIRLTSTITRAEASALICAELKLSKESDIEKMNKDSESFSPPPYIKREREKMAEGKIPDIAGHWAEESIRLVLGWGCMRLASEGHFYPDRPLTKTDYAVLMQKLLVRLSGDDSLDTKYMETESPFRDVPGAHYNFNAIMVAVDKKIIEPKQKDVFGINDNATGAEVLLGLRRVKELLSQGQLIDR